MNTFLRRVGSLFQSRSSKNLYKISIRFSGSEAEQYPHRLYDKDFERLSQESIDRSPLSVDQLNFVLPVFKRKRKELKRVDCLLCHVPKEDISFLNSTLLNFFIDGSGQIYSRKRTGCCSKHQHMLSREIKKSRSMGLLAHDANLQLGEINNMHSLFEREYMDDEIREFFEKTPIPNSVDREQAEEFRTNFNLKPLQYESDLPRVEEKTRIQADKLVQKLYEVFHLMTNYYEVLSVGGGAYYADLMSLDDKNFKQLDEHIMKIRQNIQIKLAIALRPMPTLQSSGKTINYKFGKSNERSGPSDSSVEDNNKIYVKELEKQYLRPMKEMIKEQKEYDEYLGYQSNDFFKKRKPHLNTSTPQESILKKIFTKEEYNDLYGGDSFDESDDYIDKSNKRENSNSEFVNRYNKEIIDDHFEYSGHSNDENDNLHGNIPPSGGDDDSGSDEDERNPTNIGTRFAHLQKHHNVKVASEDAIQLGLEEDDGKNHGSVPIVRSDEKSKLLDRNREQNRNKLNKTSVDPKIQIQIINDDEEEN